MSDEPSTLPTSPVPFGVAALVSWLVVTASMALALYAYFRLSYPKTVIHHGAHGETSENIESYIFSPAFIQFLIAGIITYKWLRWSADQPRIAEREQRRRADPQARPMNLDFYYRLFCVMVVLAQLILLSTTAYRTLMIAERTL